MNEVHACGDGSEGVDDFECRPVSRSTLGCQKPLRNWSVCVSSVDCNRNSAVWVAGWGTGEGKNPVGPGYFLQILLVTTNRL